MRITSAPTRPSAPSAIPGSLDRERDADQRDAGDHHQQHQRPDHVEVAQRHDHDEAGDRGAGRHHQRRRVQPGQLRDHRLLQNHGVNIRVTENRKTHGDQKSGREQHAVADRQRDQRAASRPRILRSTSPCVSLASGSNPGAMTDAPTKAMVWLIGSSKNPVPAITPPSAISKT